MKSKGVTHGSQGDDDTRQKKNVFILSLCSGEIIFFTPGIPIHLQPMLFLISLLFYKQTPVPTSPLTKGRCTDQPKFCKIPPLNLHITNQPPQAPTPKKEEKTTRITHSTFPEAQK
jgi:hypothetical protein